jgi:hypothetical protein
MGLSGDVYHIPTGAEFIPSTVCLFVCLLLFFFLNAQEKH